MSWCMVSWCKSWFLDICTFMTHANMHGTAGYMVEKVKIVSVHVRYFSFFQFLQFRSVSLSQVTSGYIRLRQFTLEGWDVELDNMKNNTDIKISYLQAESLQININCLHWSLNLNRSVYWLQAISEYPDTSSSGSIPQHNGLPPCLAGAGVVTDKLTSLNL